MKIEINLNTNDHKESLDHNSEFRKVRRAL